MITVRLNKWIDLIDRTAWAFVLALAAAIIVVGFDDWKMAVATAGLTSLGVAAKTGVAQNVGDSPIGDAVPGASVLEKPRA